MKFVVPLMMPASHSIRLAVSPSRMALMMGMPPATAASKATITPCAEAAAKISLPCLASNALFAVTTCLPCAMASSTSSRASVSPPISSTTISTSGSRTSACASLSTATPSPTRARALATSRTATRLTSMRLPARRAISSALRDSTVQVPPPTTPRPSKPILMGCSSARGKEAGVADSVLAEFVISVSRYGGHRHMAACRHVPDAARLLQQPVFAEHVLDAAHGLARALLVFDEREAHVFVAVFSEADAGRHGDLRVRQQALGEFERTHGPVRLGNQGPDVHRGLGNFHVPARFVQAARQHVAT